MKTPLKSSLLIAIVLCFCIQAVAQPSIYHESVVPGTSSHTTSMVPTNDGGFLLLGKSNDVIVVKVDSSGVVEWQKTYGGTGAEDGEALIQLADGRYAILATSSSNDGDVIGYHGGSGSPSDLWLFIISTTGELEFSRCFGGTLTDVGSSFVQKPNGNLVLCGNTYSNDGDVSGNHSTSQDSWLIEVALTGAIQWQRCYGGTGMERGAQIRLLTHNRIGFCGWGTSTNGDLAGVGNNTEQYWLVITDYSGNLLQQKCYGGTSWDDAYNFIQTTDGGYAMTGITNSSNGQVIGGNGGYEMWVVKTDSALTLQWQNPLGGSLNEGGFDIIQTSDGGYLCAGVVNSNDGDAAEVHGGSDAWLVKLNYAGAIIWQKPLGGSNIEARSNFHGQKMLHVAPDGSIYVYTGTESTDGDVSDQTFGGRFWLVRLKYLSNRIDGRVYYDLNTNNSFDAGDLAAGNKRVASTTGEATFTNQDGSYSIYVNDPGLYTVNAPNIPNHNGTPTSNSANFNVTNNDVEAGNDFAFSQVPNRDDISINVMPLTGMRKGFNAKFLITAQNVGTTALNGSIVFKIPANIATYANADLAPDSITPDSLVWYYSGLQPYQSINILVDMYISTLTNTGTFFNAITYVTPLDTDVNENNNSKILELEVLSSCDPNEIIVDRETLTEIEAATVPYLYYNIRFQNTGNDTAITVIIRDTLPSLLDASTIEFLSTTDPVQLNYNNLSRELTFTFNNIYLPDSTVNEPESHGAVSYRIKTVNNLTAGNIIENQVDIYFDFNPPVPTNIAKTEVGKLANKFDNFETSPNFRVFPNPSKNLFHIEWQPYNSAIPINLSVTDIFGRVVNESKLLSNYGEGIINLPNLPNGIYYLFFSSLGNKFHHQKIIVQR